MPMAPRVTYGKVRVAECPCCVSAPVALDSEEGRGRRRRCVRHYNTVATLQLGLSVLALASGATSLGLMVHNPEFPYVICFPLISAVLMLLAGVFGKLVGGANVETLVEAAVKRNVVLHYVLCVLGCTFCALTAAFSAVGLGFCLSPPPAPSSSSSSSSSPSEDDGGGVCWPHRELRRVFLGVDIFLGFLLFLTCIAGCVLFCMHARSLGFTNSNSSMQQQQEVDRNELNALRAQVAALTRAQQMSGHPLPLPLSSPPSAYSQSSYAVGPGSYGEYADPQGSAYTTAHQWGSQFGVSATTLGDLGGEGGGGNEGTWAARY